MREMERLIKISKKARLHHIRMIRCFPIQRIQHRTQNSLNHRNRHSISRQFPHRRVATNNLISIGKALETQHLALRQSPFTIHQQVIVRGTSSQRARIRIRADMPPPYFRAKWCDVSLSYHA